MSASDAPLYAGVDGGGTRTRSRVRDAFGTLVGEGEAGAANARRGAAAAIAAAADATRAALAAGGLGAEALARVHAGVGLAGVSQAAHFAAVTAEPHPFASRTLATDFAIACLGAHGGGDGGVVIVGTGSAACARVEGREHRFGGWGFEVGDDGGGAPLGREAVRHALRAADGLAPSGPLADAVMAVIGGDPDAAAEWAGHAAPSDFGRLAPLVFAHADNDPAAARLRTEAADHVAALILRLAGCGARRIALIGGLSEAIAPHLPPYTRATLVAPLADPAEGALMLVRRPEMSA